MKLSEEVRQLCITEPGRWWLVKDKLADRIAELEAELAAAPQKERDAIADAIYPSGGISGITRERLDHLITLKFTVGSSGCGCLISDSEELIHSCSFHADLVGQAEQKERERLAKLAESRIDGWHSLTSEEILAGKLL